MKKLFIFALFIITLFNFTPFKAFADTTSNTYYVDLINGNDSNAGTSANKALKNVEKAYEKANASGDTICIIGSYTFKNTTNLPPKSVKITSLDKDNKSEINFRDSVSINADTVFENVDLAFMYPEEDGGRAIYANGHNLTIGPGVDTNYQEGIKYASVYGGSRSGSISSSPNITLISGQFDTIYAGGRDNNTVTSATINLNSDGTLELANVDASSSLNNVVINYTNSGSKISNKVNASGGIVNFIGTNTDLNYPIENASQISMISSTLNIYERGDFKNSSKEKLNFSLDSNSILKIGKDGIFDVNGNFDGSGTINFGPNSYLNINGKVSGQTKITQIFTASRQGIVSANLGTEDNFYLNDDSYCQIEFEQNYDSVKWNIIIPSEAPKTYYINGTAENHGDGSSIENPLPTIEEAIANSKHGDYIYICGDTDVTGDLNIDKDITISGTEDAKLNFVSESPLINITDGYVIFESNLNITGSIPDIYMDYSTAILNGGKFNKIYSQENYVEENKRSELKIRGSLINAIESIASVTTTGYGENNNFVALPNLRNVESLIISSSYIEFNGSLVDIKNLTVENSTINILDNTSIPGASTLGDPYENLAVKLNIASGKKLEFKSSIQLLSDISIDVIGNPDESIYLVCTEIGGSGSIKSTHPENYEFEEIKDESSTSYKLKRKPEYIVPVSSIKLDKSNISLEKGETEKINAVVLPEYAADKSIYWISSDNNIATVDEDGNVKAISKGAVNITAITNDGNKTGICVVNVSEKIIPVTSIELDKTNLSLEVGNRYKITATVLPENATDKTLVWESSNTDVVTVDESGNITAVSKGTTTITVSSGNVKNECIVNVTEKVIPATSIKLDKTDLSLIVGDSYTINAIVLPKNATDKTLKWASSNPEVATVDNSGNVTAISKGITTIMVSSYDESIKAYCNVNIYNVSDAEIELSNAIEEANKVLEASNPKVQDLLKEIIKLSKAINNLNNEQ